MTCLFIVTCKSCEVKSRVVSVPMGKPFICPRCGNLDYHKVEIEKLDDERLAIYLDPEPSKKE